MYLNIFFQIILLTAIVTFVIIGIYPAWLETNWAIQLVPSVFVVVLPIYGILHEIFSPIIQKKERLKKLKNTFARVTDNSERVLKPKLSGIPKLIQRIETRQIMQKIMEGKSILLTGEAGSGKSGVATALVNEAKNNSFFPILVDARRLAEINQPQDLNMYFDIKDDSIIDCINEVSKNSKVILIIDQLDNVVGFNSSKVLTDFLINFSNHDRVYVVAIGRHKESNEKGALRPLVDSKFEIVPCQKLEDDLIKEVFKSVGILAFSEGLLSLAKNLLNLELICEIARMSPQSEILNLIDEIHLWEKYRLTLISRENNPLFSGEDFVFEATRLAILGLRTVDRSFEINYPPNNIQLRLCSTGIINSVHNIGNKYQFTLEKMQDYLYAWYACQRGFNKTSVENEIGDLHLRNIFIWMREIYQVENHPQYAIFFEEVLSG